ncbi:MAG: serine hydrolase, partial [Gemmatimonadota bacterium]
MPPGLLSPDPPRSLAMIQRRATASRLLALALALVAVGSLQAPLSAQRSDQVLRNALVHGATMGIPGISVAIGVGDSVVWAGTAGFNDVLRHTPLTTNDRFGVGSITKTFVARVILQLVQEGT